MDFNGTNNNMNKPYQGPRQMNNNTYNNRGGFAPRANDGGFVDGVQPAVGPNGNMTPNGSAPYNSYNRRNNSGLNNGFPNRYNNNYNGGSASYYEDWSKPMAADERLEA